MKLTPARISAAAFLPIVLFGCLEAVYQRADEADPLNQKTHWEEQKPVEHRIPAKTASATAPPRAKPLTERQRLQAIADVWFITPYDLKHDDLKKVLMAGK